VGPRAVLDAVVKRKIASPRRESNPRTPIVQPVLSLIITICLPQFRPQRREMMMCGRLIVRGMALLADEAKGNRRGESFEVVSQTAVTSHRLWPRPDLTKGRTF
jgi:hypothetical protein